MHAFDLPSKWHYARVTGTGWKVVTPPILKLVSRYQARLPSVTYKLNLKK